METTISDKRRVKDETVGHAAKVSTSTLKPKTKASTPKAAKTKTKTKQTADDQAAIERAMASQGLEPEALPAAPKRGRPKHLQSVPDPEPDPFEGLEQVEGDDAWCGLCGGALLQTPKGAACRLGHGEPERLGWEAAAQLLYDGGATTRDAADLMEAEEADVQAFFDELDARPAGSSPAEPAPGASAEETERGAIQSFRAGATYETVERFYGEAIGAERLQQLFEQHGTKPEPEPEPPAEPEPTEVIEYEPVSLDGAEAVAEYFEHKHLPPQVAMGGHGQAAQIAAMEADDAHAAEVPRAVPGNAPAMKSWVELQLATAPLSAADYERLGRLWVGALIAGVDIQTYARREREVLAAVRSDILGRLDPGRGGE